MTDSYAIDISTARPAAAAIRAAGYSAVLGYLSGGLLLDGQPKDLDAAYIASLHAEPLGVGFIWETGAQVSLEGQAQGTADGQAALAELRSLGAPAGMMVLANLGDFAATAEQIAVIHDYYYGFHQQLLAYQVGGYATGYIIEQLVAGGAIGIWWQNAIDDEGVSGSVVTAAASLYQRTTPTLPAIAGTSPGDYDEDVYGFQTAPNWWQPAAAAPPATGPTPAPTTLVSVGPAGAVLSTGGTLAWQ